MNGQLFKMWKQAPSVFSRLEDVYIPLDINTLQAHSCIEKQKSIYWETYEIGDKKIWVKTHYQKTEATRDLNCKIADREFDKIDLQSNAGQLRANAIHTFAVARIVLNMYLRALKRIKPDIYGDIWQSFLWKNKKERLTIQVDFKESVTGYVKKNSSTSNPEINTGRLVTLRDVKTEEVKKREFECRDFDRLAHEVGHAIFDAIRFDLNKFEFLNEAFADLTAMFSLLSMMDICDRLVVSTKCDLTQKNFLSVLGEINPFDTERTRNMGGTEITDINALESHTASLPISSAIYQCLVAIFNLHQKPSEYDPSESLFRVSRQLLDVFLYAILNLEEKKLTRREDLLPHLQEKMLEGIEKVNISSDEGYLAGFAKIIREKIVLRQ